MKLTDEQHRDATLAARTCYLDRRALLDWQRWRAVVDAVAATLPDAPTNPAPTLERGPDTPSPITWEDMREGDRVRVEWEAILINGFLDRDSDPTYYLLARKPDPRVDVVRRWWFDDIDDDHPLTPEAARDLLARLDELGSES